MMKNQKRAVCLLACLLIAGFTAAQEKKESAQTASGSKEEGNRNVMLNASSANGPREISIGLPGTWAREGEDNKYFYSTRNKYSEG